MRERSTIRRQKVAIFGLLVALTFTLAGFAIASAAVNNSDGTVAACYKNTNGNVHVQVKPCKAGKETAITLNGSVPIFAVVNASGAILHGKHVVSVDHGATSLGGPITGADVVKFDRNVSGCALTASNNDLGAGFVTSVLPESNFGQNPNWVVVETEQPAGTAAFIPYSVTATC